MRALPPPEFINTNPADVETALIARYEELSGKTLYPAQIERLLIDQIAYAETRMRLAIQHAGEQLLVRYSSGPILEYLADLVGVTRLMAQPSVTTLRFWLREPGTVDIVVPAGTAVCSRDGRVQVSTVEPVRLPAGQVAVEVGAVCSEVGATGNGWAAGQLNTLVSPLGELQVTNLTATSGGADDETDANLADRICLAPESYSNAGSEGAYLFHVRSVHQSIIDVAVLGPDDGLADGHVELYPLTNTGLPSAELLGQVDAALSARNKRPLTDKVTARAPLEVPYAIAVRLDIYASADPDITLAAARAAAEQWAAERRAGLRRSIVPEQISRALQVAGVYRPHLTAPLYRELARNEWANCYAIELALGEVVVG